MGITGNLAHWEAESFGFELVDLTVGDLLDEQARRHGEREALVYAYPELGITTRLTYAQYRDAVNRLAKGLLAWGIAPGENVAVLAPNRPEWLLLEMALAKIGAVLVTVNTAYRQAELEYLLRQGDVCALFLAESHRDNRYLDSLHALAPEIAQLRDPAREPLRCAALPSLRRVALIGGAARPGLLGFDDVMALGDTVPDAVLAARQAAVKAGDVVQIQYTSGTTGFPKGVMLTHHGIVNNARLTAARAGFTAEDRMVTPMPLFHTAGCVLCVLGTLSVGGTLIPAIAFDAGKVLELIHGERGTLINAVPTMLIAMLNEPRFQAGRFDTSSLRIALTGGTPIPVVLMEQVKARMGAEPVIVLGLTETSPIITQTLNDDAFELRAATVGLPMPHTDIRIADPATGQTLAAGQEGELLVRGYMVMRGYYRMPEKTAETIDADGWLHTGDLATMDERGYVKIVGRVKDMIIRGGENLYPAEIENFLMRHPGIAEAQVVGVPDDYMGEEAAALLRLKPGETADEAAIRDWCRANISRHKVPRYIRFVESYPTTASGKVKKYELRRRMAEEVAASRNSGEGTAPG